MKNRTADVHLSACKSYVQFVYHVKKTNELKSLIKGEVLPT